MTEKSERHRQGMATRRKVLGDAYVDRAQAARTTFSEPFQDLITEAAWSHVWSRDTITLRERSMLTLALHTRATANTGASRDDIMEVMLHVAIYAGVPRANHAMKVVSQALDEMEGGKKA